MRKNINDSHYKPGHSKHQQNNRYMQINQQQQSYQNQKGIDHEDQIRYSYPVDLQKCLNHRWANIIFKEVQQNQQFSIYKKRCQCCGKIIGHQPQPTICYDTLQLATFGPGIPLYFLFFKYIIKLLVVCLLIFGIYAFISNINQFECSLEKKCKVNDFFSKESILNGFSSQSVVLTQKYLILGLLIVLIILMQWVRYKIKQERRLIDQFLISPSDYAIIIRRLPQKTQKKDIQKMVYQMEHFLQKNQKIETNNLKIEKIIFGKKCSQYNEIMKNNLQQFKIIIQNYKDLNENLGKSDKEIKQQIFKLFKSNKLNPPQMNQNLSSAIVVFQREISKKYFLHSIDGKEKLINYFWYGYKPLSNMHRVKGQYVSIQRAPQPDDIIWENIGYQMNQLFLRRSVSFLVSIVLLFVGGLFQYLLIKWRVNNIQSGTTLQTIFSIISALLITATNYLIQIILIKSTTYQMPDTYTQLKMSLTIKIILLQFINSGIAMILVNAIVFIPDYRSQKSLITSDVINLMSTNAIVNNLVVFLLNYFQILHIWPRYKIQNQKEIYTQLEANKIYEAPPVQLQYKYAYIFKTFWLTAFFFPTVPIVILISLLGLLLNYLIQMLLFSSKYTIPNMLSAKLSISIMYLLNYTFLWLTLGSFLIHLLKRNFHYDQIPFSVMLPHFICLVISIISIFAPLDPLFNNIFSKKQEKVILNKQYKQFQHKFQSTYQQTNPAYNGGVIYRKKQLGLNQKLLYNLIRQPHSQFYKEIKNNWE